MIALRIPELRRLGDLRHDFRLGEPLRLRQPRDFLRYLGLFGRVGEDGTSVLGACVGALTVLGRGVVHAVEEFDEGGIGELGWVECYLEGFGVFFCLIK